MVEEVVLGAGVVVVEEMGRDGGSKEIDSGDDREKKERVTEARPWPFYAKEDWEGSKTRKTRSARGVWYLRRMLVFDGRATRRKGGREHRLGQSAA